MTTTKKNLIKTLLGAVIALAAMLLIPALKAEAAQTEITIESSDEADTSVLLDDDFHTFDYYNEKTQLCIKSSEVMTGIYIKWDTIPGSWKLIIDGQEYVYGQNDFIHEYVELPVASDTVYMVMAKDKTYITDIYGFTAGELPSWVQVWQPAYEKADILLYSTHADDECIFFGGIIPNYTNNNRARVEVAYFTDQWKEGVNGTEDYRNHEKLDGLWTMGVDHYPAMGEFPDLYSESIEEAKSSFDNDHALEYTVELIRRFKPQVLVGQDLINGEYGHGGHMYTAWLLTEAVEKANDPAQYPDSAQKYGTWDTPKLYLHMYPENQIVMDARQELSSFGGKTALEVAQEGYDKHISQNYTWFYVTDGMDGYEMAGNNVHINCVEFGLYRTQVGLDTGNDILENLTPYDQQAPEVVPTDETSTDETPEDVTEPVTEEQKGMSPAVKVIIIILIVIVAIAVILLIWALIVKSIRAKRARARKARRRNMRR